MRLLHLFEMRQHESSQTYLVVAKSEVEAKDVNACIQHLVHLLCVVARGTERSNN